METRFPKVVKNGHLMATDLDPRFKKMESFPHTSKAFVLDTLKAKLPEVGEARQSLSSPDKRSKLAQLLARPIGALPSELDLYESLDEIPLRLNWTGN